MIDVTTSFEEPQLWLRVSGIFGHGDQNLSSGRAVQSALELALEKNSDRVSEVIIDYSDVSKIGGDGPLWSVHPALRRRLVVRFIASDENHQWLLNLLEGTRMNRFIQLELRGDC